MSGSQKGFVGIGDDGDCRYGVADRRPVFEPLSGNTVCPPVDHQNDDDYIKAGADQSPMNDFVSERSKQSDHFSIPPLKTAILDVLWILCHDRFMILVGGFLCGCVSVTLYFQHVLAEFFTDARVVELCRQVLK